MRILNNYAFTMVRYLSIYTSFGVHKLSQHKINLLCMHSFQVGKFQFQCLKKNESSMCAFNYELKFPLMCIKIDLLCMQWLPNFILAGIYLGPCINC
jgi:hypothetical protein